MTDEDDDRRPSLTAGEWTPITDLRISSERIEIRKRAVERHGIERGDVLDVWIYPDGTEPIYLPDVVVVDSRRINIPARRMEMYEIEGTNVDIEFRDTGRDYPDDTE